jgi:hypothetical protein
MSICSTGLGLAGGGIGLEDLITDEEAAGLLRVMRGTLATWRSKGKGPHFVKLGRRIYYARGDIQAFVAGQRQAPSKSAA